MTVFAANVTDREALLDAAKEVSKITGGTLDLLINNAGIGGQQLFKDLQDFPSLGDLENDLMETFRVNTVGPALSTGAFLPLIRKGQLKKVITISSGMADDNLTNKYSIGIQGPYAASKAAVNTLMAKYNAALGPSEGILFLAICPGVVNTDMNDPSKFTEEEAQGMQAMGAKFVEYAPHFKGPDTTEESVNSVVDVINKATVEEMGGQYVSHFGNKQWV